MSPYPQSHPPAAQPPVQIPYSDPFHNRDPFMPGAQHRREKSYGGPPSAPPAGQYGGERAWQGQQAYPPHLQHAHNANEQRHEGHSYDSNRRRSIGAAASPPRFHAAPVDGPHPPPPPYHPRGMRPPSPSPSNATSYHPHDPPPARAPMSNSPFGGRDNAPFQPRRDGPFSIGSLVGGDRANAEERGPNNAQHQPSSFPPMGSGAVPTFRAYQSSPSTMPGPQQHASSESAVQRPNSQPNGGQRQTYSEPWRPPVNEPHAPPHFREYPHQRPEENPQYARSDGPRRSQDHTSAPHPQYSHGYYPPQHDDRRPQGPAYQPAPQEAAAVEPRFRQYGGPASDREAVRRDEEIQPTPRRLLTVSPELNRREGRSSPLPQAVQGAQHRWLGPGRDSNIKNEFGRMFSGLGSGVGSGRGDLTPSRMSPARFPDSANPGDRDSPADGALPHKGDRSSVPRDLQEAASGRNTPVDQVGANKRMKVAHVPAHHHHHHTHGHHHHHHHHASPDETANARGGFSTLRFPQYPSQPAHGQTSVPHHHHHIVSTHHHHHVPKPTQSPIFSEVTVSNREVLSQATQAPRAHLGSSLYQASISLPPAKRVLIDTRLMFASTAKTIPLFEDRENCTFTIRVPREYISSEHVNTDDQIGGGLEEICKRRALWGSDIYTDDSDVVAAAVHSGWIKGDFGDFNEDIENLFGGKEEANKAEEQPKSLSTKPNRPVAVPQNRDMHVTILIMPPLKDYAASTRHYLRSRAWGGDHDGMSFMIHSIDFVDEPRSSRFMDRGSKGLKERLKDEQRRRREAAESLLGLGIGAPAATPA